VGYEYSKLLGRIKEICGSQAVFASRIMLSERAVSLKLNSKRDWKQDEIRRACEILSIEKEDIPQYFFSPKVQN
jgi:hypothetical protein